jgi:uncharacterized protein YbjQ (UPF0145 family)
LDFKNSLLLLGTHLQDENFLLHRFDKLAIHLQAHLGNVCRSAASESCEIIQDMTHDLVTTAFTLDGYRIVQTLGLVRGIVVRSRSIFGTIGAGLQTIVGGNITLLTELCEKTRSHAFDLMVEHAMDLGANAIIGTRYDATEVMSGVTEVLCYGTAVVVEKI